MPVIAILEMNVTIRCTLIYLSCFFIGGAESGLQKYF